MPVTECKRSFVDQHNFRRLFLVLCYIILHYISVFLTVHYLCACRTLFYITTVFVDTRLSKTKHPRKRFQNFRQSCVLYTVRIEIHQLQPLVWPSNLLYVMLLGCDWWILIRSVNNTQDWQKFWKHFRGCFVFKTRVSTKTVVTSCLSSFWGGLWHCTDYYSGAVNTGWVGNFILTRVVEAD